MVPAVVVSWRVDPRASNSYYCLSIVLEGKLEKKRDAFVARLNETGIGTSVYYPQPVPRMTYYRSKYGYNARCYPEAERISACSIALPVGPHLDGCDIDRIVESFKKIAEDFNNEQ